MGSARARRILITCAAILTISMLVADAAEAGWWRRLKDLGRDSGSEAGKVIAGPIRIPGTLQADVLVYANLVQPSVACIRLDDIDRVDKKIRLGDSIGVLGSGRTEDGCQVALRWWRIGRSPRADGITSIRHDIAIRFLGVSDPRRMARFIGGGTNHLHRAELERLASQLPRVVRAFEVWGIELDVTGRSHFDRIQLENESLRRRIEKLEKDLDCSDDS